MAIVLPIFIFLALAGLFLFLAVRASRTRRGWIKWTGMVLSGLLSIVFLAVAVVGAIGWSKLNIAPHRYTVSDVQVAMTPEKIARGGQIANLCADCHSSSGSTVLDGSADNMLAGPGAPPVGMLWAPNLTPGGSIKDWSDGEIIRAIREGVDANGKPLVIMPSIAFKHMSDEDVQALVAYLRSQPAVDRPVPDRDLNVIGALVLGAGLFPTMAQEPITGPVVAPEKGSPAYGEYLVNIAGCGDCHGAKLDGNGLYGPGVDLTTIVPNWNQEEFFTFFRQQVDPKTGRAIDPMNMPVPSYNKMFSDADLSDIYQFMHRLEPMATTGQ